MKQLALLFILLQANLLFGQLSPIEEHRKFNSVFFKAKTEQILSKHDFKFLMKTNYSSFTQLYQIANEIIETQPKYSVKIYEWTSKYGIISSSNLKKYVEQKILTEKQYEKIKSVYLDSVTPEMIQLKEELAKRLAVEQHFRRKWMRKKDTLALREFERLDSINFDFVNDALFSGKMPSRREFYIEGDFFPMFLHVTSEKLGNDSLAFENYREKILQLVLKGKFHPSMYVLWVDRFHKFNLKSEKQIYGTFRSYDTPADELPEVIEPEKLNERRDEIGFKSKEMGIKLRVLREAKRKK